MRVLVVTAVPAERDAVLRGLSAAYPDTAAQRGTGAPPTAGEAATAAADPMASAERAKPAEIAVPGYTLHRVPADQTRTAAASATSPPQPASSSGEPPPSGDCPHPAAPVVDVLSGGLGPAGAAAAAATALTAASTREAPYHLVISAGIGGGFTRQPAGGFDGADRPGAPVGRLVVADAIVAADLGAETPDGFLSVTELGFGRVEHRPPPALLSAITEASGGMTGAVLTVSTVTGSAERAAELLLRHPEALVEAMEGFGVAEAAAAHGVPVLELRTISNPVGPRDRAAWRIGEALDTLSDTFRKIAPVLRSWEEPAP